MTHFIASCFRILIGIVLLGCAVQAGSLRTPQVTVAVLDHAEGYIVPCTAITSFTNVDTAWRPKPGKKFKPPKGKQWSGHFQGCIGRDIEWGKYYVSGLISHRFLGGFTGTCDIYDVTPVCIIVVNPFHMFWYRVEAHLTGVNDFSKCWVKTSGVFTKLATMTAFDSEGVARFVFEDYSVTFTVVKDGEPIASTLYNLRQTPIVGLALDEKNHRLVATPLAPGTVSYR